MTSNVSSESPMLTVSSGSKRNGGTGRINSRIVPKSPKISHKSPCLSKPRILSLKAPMQIILVKIISPRRCDGRNFFAANRS